MLKNQVEVSTAFIMSQTLVNGSKLGRVEEAGLEGKERLIREQQGLSWRSSVEDSQLPMQGAPGFHPFLYRYKFSSQKENLYLAFKSFSASAGSQWTLVH